MPPSRDTRSPSSSKITASPSKAIRICSLARLPGLARSGRIVAAATPLASARRTDSGLADRNSCAPNGRIYGQVGSPEVNVAREIASR